MTEYLKGNKSLIQYFKRRLQSPEKIKKEYYGTIKLTRELFEMNCGEVEDLLSKGKVSSIEQIVEHTQFKSEQTSVIEFSKNQFYVPYHYFLYFLTRFLKPKIVIETGVERGSSTYMILKAMEKNNSGLLHSIELCKEVSFSNKVKVPMALMLENEDSLKKRWILHTGNSLEVLPVLVESGKSQNRSADIFVSGSDHSFSIQYQELVYAKNIVKSGGIVVCDRPDYSNHKALNEVFPVDNYIRYILPEKSVNSPLEFAVIRT